MLHKVKTSPLRDAVRDCISYLNAGADGWTNRMLWECMSLRHADLIRSAADDLAYGAIINIASKLRKNTAQTSIASRDQFVLPEFAGHLLRRLPAMVGVPPSDDFDEESDFDEDSLRWKPLGRCTVGELGRHIKMLEEQMRRDQSRAQAIRELYDLCISTAGVSDDTEVSRAVRLAGSEAA